MESGAELWQCVVFMIDKWEAVSGYELLLHGLEMLCQHERLSQFLDTHPPLPELTPDNRLLPVAPLLLILITL